jgi:Restriction endonuclease
LTNSDFAELLEYIQKCSESQLRNIITNFFVGKGIMTRLTHGPLERGADIILSLVKNKDVIGRGQIFFFQVKKGKINTKIWREGLHSQLYELYDREIDVAPYDSAHMPRRIVLVTSGVIEEPVRQKMHRMNIKHHIPIEFLDGSELTQFLLDNDYEILSAKRDIKLRYL